MEMHLLDLFFIKRRPQLDPEASRTLIVLLLTFSPELMLGSSVLAQSERVFLLFNSKLVQFSSNFFNLDANFLVSSLFSFSEKGFLVHGNFPPEKLALSAFWQEGFPFPQLALCNLHLFLLKMLITATTAVTLPVFAVSIAISSALKVSLGAVLAT
jgi:hypothetical protein